MSSSITPFNVTDFKSAERIKKFYDCQKDMIEKGYNNQYGDM